MLTPNEMKTENAIYIYNTFHFFIGTVLSFLKNHDSNIIKIWHCLLFQKLEISNPYTDNLKKLNT